MIILSLFDGMSCGQIALKELGVKVDKYYASEVDRFAIAQTQLNFPDTIQLGDVSKWKEWDIDWSNIDLVIGGFCCQSFSSAGCQRGFDDVRGQLFFTFAEIVDFVIKHNPKAKFLGENVRMMDKHQSVIDKRLGIRPVEINSSLVSAQNRVRLYWTNIRTKEVGLFGELHSDIPQPKDRKLYLKDILEDSVDDKFYLSNVALKGLLKHKERHESNGNGFGVDIRYLDQKGQTVRLGGKGMYDLVYDSANYFPKNAIYRHSMEGFEGYSNKSPAIKSSTGSGNQIIINEAMCVDNTDEVYSNNNHLRYETPKVVGNTNEKFEQESRVFSINGKSPTLLANSPQEKSKILDNREDDVVQLSASKESGGKQPYQQNRIYADYGKSPCLDLDHRKNVLTNRRIRRLTPTECARLQTIPEWYKWECSDTQQYKMLGNGWTVEVIKHIFSFM